MLLPRQVVAGFPTEAQAWQAQKEHISATKTGAGKRSSEEMVASDDAFLMSCQAALRTVADLESLPADVEEDMSAQAGELAKAANSLVAKAVGKMQSLKRRKTVDATVSPQLGSIVATARLLQTLLHELSYENPNPREFDSAMTSLDAVGYHVSGIALFKLCRAYATDELKFGRYDSVARMFSPATKNGAWLVKLDELKKGEQDQGQELSSRNPRPRPKPQSLSRPCLSNNPLPSLCRRLQLNPFPSGP